MRKLASIQKIKEIVPIEGADRIELAKVLGWQCVVNKGQYKPEDLVVYCEVDSFLPIEEQYEFLRNNSFKKNPILGEGFRIKTQKFRGELSQGLVLPLTAIPADANVDITEGTDVTDILHIREWEMPEMATGSGTVIGDLPDGAVASDEVRIQSCPELLEAFRGLKYYISSKCDGTSMSVLLDKNGKFHVNGHHKEFKDDGKCTLYEKVKEIDLENKMKALCKEDNITELFINGEYCGEGIQKNPLGLKSPEWFIFTIRENGERVGLDRMIHICEVLGLKTVPIEEVDEDLPSKYPNEDALLTRADGNYTVGEGRRKEGIVIRPVDPVFSPILSGPLSVKVISNKYLLKQKD